MTGWRPTFEMFCWPGTIHVGAVAHELWAVTATASLLLASPAMPLGPTSWTSLSVHLHPCHRRGSPAHHVEILKHSSYGYVTDAFNFYFIFYVLRTQPHVRSLLPAELQLRNTYSFCYIQMPYFFPLMSVLHIV